MEHDEQDDILLKKAHKKWDNNHNIYREQGIIALISSYTVRLCMASQVMLEADYP